MSTSTSVDPASATSTSNPDQAVSDDGGNSSSGPVQHGVEPPPWPPKAPNELPIFVAADDGAGGKAYYTNITIDDFSPLITFSNASAVDWPATVMEWWSPATDPALTTVDPSSREWHLGTCKRTERTGATATIEFYGSEIYLYGDTGPLYGGFSIAVDNGTATEHDNFYPAQAAGKSHFMAAVKNLTEGRHTLTLTNVGGREELNFSSGAFLLDFAVVRQRVGLAVNGTEPGWTSVANEELDAVPANGTWVSNTVMDYMAPGPGGATPEIYIETRTRATTERYAALTHTFKGAGIQVWGRRNATHGTYRATLAAAGAANGTAPLHDAVYDAVAPCGFPLAPGEPDVPDVRPPCEWRGSALRFAAADLDPAVEHTLVLQNLGAGSADAIFEIDKIRVFAMGPARDGDGGGSGSSGAGEDGAAMGLAAPNALVAFVTMFLTLMLVRRVSRC